MGLLRRLAERRSTTAAPVEAGYCPGAARESRRAKADLPAATAGEGLAPDPRKPVSALLKSPGCLAFLLSLTRVPAGLPPLLRPPVTR